MKKIFSFIAILIIAINFIGSSTLISFLLNNDSNIIRVCSSDGYRFIDLNESNNSQQSKKAPGIKCPKCFIHAKSPIFISNNQQYRFSAFDYTEKYISITHHNHYKYLKYKIIRARAPPIS